MAFFKKSKGYVAEKDPREEFIIPQIKKKVSGINEKKDEFKTSNFVSPMFGRAVPDAPVIPENHSLSDIGKGYDTFREHPIAKEHDDYSDFGSSIINNRTRKRVFGEEARIVECESDEAISDSVKMNFLGVKSLKDVLEKKQDDFSFDTKEFNVPLMEEEKTVRFEQTREDSNRLETEPEIPVRNTPLPPFMQLSREEVKIDSFEIKSSDFGTHESFETTINEWKKQINADIDDVVSKLPEEKSDISIEDDVPFFKLKNVGSNKEDVPAKKVEPSYAYYRLPSPGLFRKKFFDKTAKPEWISEQIELINSTLSQFEIDGAVESFTKGPTVTRYEIKLKPGINVKKVLNIQNNLKMALSAKTIRIEAPIPGKPNIGVEVPNVIPEEVAFGNIVDTEAFISSKNPLLTALGLNIDGDVVYQDITKMPHGLVAGATGSGKSVCVNTMLISLLLKNKPDELKLMLIDPKVVELLPYNDLPHLVTPVINDPKMAAAGLKWAVDEMENRYHQFADFKVRNIEGYNQKVQDYREYKKMPYIVIVIDELADLIMVASSEVEEFIRRLTQKSRACGIHLLVATQRPTIDVIKGTIKANIPFRLTFKVSSISDSVVALDSAGAECLLGKGDMLLKDGENITRIQGAYISDTEIESVTEYIKNQAPANYLFELDSLNISSGSVSQDDELFEIVARFVVENQAASINRIQREFSIGFNRAQRLFDALADAKIVSESQGSKPREVLVTLSELEEMLQFEKG